MSMFRVLYLVGILCLSMHSARADIIVEPMPTPQERILSGILSRESTKKDDGSTVYGRLFLTVGDSRIDLPTVSGSIVLATKADETIDAAAFVGKKVNVKAMVMEFSRRGGTQIRVVSVTRIEEGV